MHEVRSGTRLLLTDEVPSGGAESNAVAAHGDYIDVLNTAGSSREFAAVSRQERSGFGIDRFSPDGRFLLVAERTANRIDVFRVLANGELSQAVCNPNAAPEAFAATFRRT